MQTPTPPSALGEGHGGGGIYSIERLLAAALLTTSGPGALSQWLGLVREITSFFGDPATCLAIFIDPISKSRSPV